LNCNTTNPLLTGVSFTGFTGLGFHYLMKMSFLIINNSLYYFEPSSLTLAQEGNNFPVDECKFGNDTVYCYRVDPTLYELMAYRFNPSTKALEQLLTSPIANVSSVVDFQVLENYIFFDTSDLGSNKFQYAIPLTGGNPVQVNFGTIQFEIAGTTGVSAVGRTTNLTGLCWASEPNIDTGTCISNAYLPLSYSPAREFSIPKESSSFGYYAIDFMRGVVASENCTVAGFDCLGGELNTYMLDMSTKIYLGNVPAGYEPWYIYGNDVFSLIVLYDPNTPGEGVYFVSPINASSLVTTGISSLGGFLVEHY